MAICLCTANMCLLVGVVCICPRTPCKGPPQGCDSTLFLRNSTAVQGVCDHLGAMLTAQSLPAKQSIPDFVENPNIFGAGGLLPGQCRAFLLLWHSCKSCLCNLPRGGFRWFTPLFVIPQSFIKESLVLSCPGVKELLEDPQSAPPPPS